MTNELATPQKCVVLRNGVEIWTDSDKAEKFGNDLVRGFKGVVKFEGRFINTADLIGVFFPTDMEDLTRRKNKQWKCRRGKWHDRESKCACLPKEQEKKKQKREEAITNCGKCKDGWITNKNNRVEKCECVINL